MSSIKLMFIHTHPLYLALVWNIEVNSTKHQQTINTCSPLASLPIVLMLCWWLSSTPRKNPLRPQNTTKWWPVWPSESAKYKSSTVYAYATKPQSRKEEMKERLWRKTKKMRKCWKCWYDGMKWWRSEMWFSFHSDADDVVTQPPHVKYQVGASLH